jgi:hypothetical protein
MFLGNLILKSENIMLPAKSSGITAPDFLLWSYLKGQGIGKLA